MVVGEKKREGIKDKGLSVKKKVRKVREVRKASIKAKVARIKEERIKKKK